MMMWDWVWEQYCIARVSWSQSLVLRQWRNTKEEVVFWVDFKGRAWRLSPSTAIEHLRKTGQEKREGEGEMNA